MSTRHRVFLAAIAVVAALAVGRCGKSGTPPTAATPGTTGAQAGGVEAGVHAGAAPDAGAAANGAAGAGTGSIGAGSPGVVPAEAKQAHEDAARIAAASIKALLAAQDFDNAQRLAANSAKDYADTASAGEFAPLLQQAQSGAAAVARDKAQAAAAPADEKAARHARFAAARDAGIAAMDKQDYTTAVGQFQNALKEEDDPETRGMLQHASNFVGKPRIAVAEFAVVGDVGIADAGKAVPELMLGQFDARRFELVERSWLDSILAQQGLSAAQVAEMPALLRVRRVDAVRYLVVGTVSRLGALTVSARLVDVSTGEVVQTADVVAADAPSLQNSLGELTAILQMTNEEKANYIAFRQRQDDAMTGVDPAAQAGAESQRQAALVAQRQQAEQQQAAAFGQAQHERDAQVALGDIKALFAQADYANALRYIGWARPRFGDTSAGQELAAMEGFAQAKYQDQVAQQRNAAAWAQAQQELAARHQRFVQFRDQGMAALAANDMIAAMGLLQNALNEEDNPDVRGVLDYVVRRMQRPGIAVLDFDVRGDIGMPPRDAPRWLSSYLLQQFAGADSPYRVVDRGEFAADLQRVGLTLADVRRDPLQPRMRLLRDQVRFVIVGTANHGSIVLSTAMIDLAAGRTVQTADFVAEDIRSLADALAGTAQVLQMSDDQKAAYLAQMDYANWMGRGDAAAAGQQWDVALDAYNRAYRVSNSQEALDRLTFATQQVADMQRARRAYETAMAAATDSARRGDWEAALDLYRQALGILPSPEARAGLENARAKVIAAARDRRALYTSSMNSGANFARNGDWDRAMDAYQQAFAIDPTPEARAAVAQAQQAISDRQAAKQRAYASAMSEAKAAIQAGNWARALDAFTRAAAILDTREAGNGMTMARKKLAESDATTKLYTAAMLEARNAALAGDWAKALAAHKRAAEIMNTGEVQVAIEQDKKQLAAIQQRDQKKLYDAAMADAATRVAAAQWQEALAAYRSAYEVQKTKEAAAGVAQASKMLSDAAYNKKQYDKAMADAAAAVRIAAWDKALIAYQAAVSIDATAEARAGVDKAKQEIAAAALADKKRQYTQFMGEGENAARASDWKKALGAYTKAAAVDNTTEAQAAIASVQKKITDADAAAAAALDQKRQYTQLIAQGDAAARAGDWQKALDAYNKAAAIDNTAAVQANITSAKTKLSEAANAAAAADAKRKQYDDLMTEANAAVAANDWQKALDAFTKAGAVNNTAQVQAGVTNARRQLAAANAAAAADARKKQYDDLMADANAAVAANDWQKALDTFTRAGAVNNTPQVQAGVANAKKKLADAAALAAADARKKQYDTAMADAAAAGKLGDWQKALDAYNKAAAIDNTAEVKAGIAAAKKQLADSAAITAAADAKKKDFAKFMSDGDAAARTNAWQRALDAYNRALAIESTSAPAQAGAANAKAKLAEAASAASAAADRKKQYDAAMAEGDTAAKAGDWEKALAAYTRTAAIDNTREVQADIATAKKKIADAAATSDKKKQYDAAIADAVAAATAGDWQKALDAYTKAAALDSTAEAKAGIAAAKKKLADVTAKAKDYAKAMSDGDAAAKANSWQKALDAYTKALVIDATPDAQAGIDNAKKKLADAADAAAAAAEKKKTYDKFISDGDTAAKSSDWQPALDAYNQAATIDNTAAVKAKIANAKTKLYARLKADGDALVKTNSWQKALDAYNKAADVNNTPEIQAAIASVKKRMGG